MYPTSNSCGESFSPRHVTLGHCNATKDTPIPKVLSFQQCVPNLSFPFGLSLSGQRLGRPGIGHEQTLMILHSESSSPSAPASVLAPAQFANTISRHAVFPNASGSRLACFSGSGFLDASVLNLSQDTEAPTSSSTQTTKGGRCQTRTRLHAADLFLGEHKAQGPQCLSQIICLGDQLISFSFSFSGAGL